MPLEPAGASPTVIKVTLARQGACQRKHYLPSKIALAEPWVPRLAHESSPALVTIARMAGYSGTPLPRKLGIKAGSRVALIGAPNDFLETLGPLPEGVSLVDPRESNIDVLVAFVRNPGEVEEAFAALKPRLAWSGGLWLAWPKKRPGQPVRLLESTVREVGLAAGLVDNKVCAIDDRWSGLRFVWRLQDRPTSLKTEARAR